MLCKSIHIIPLINYKLFETRRMEDYAIFNAGLKLHLRVLTENLWQFGDYVTLLKRISKHMTLQVFNATTMKTVVFYEVAIYKLCRSVAMFRRILLPSLSLFHSTIWMMEAAGSSDRPIHFYQTKGCPILQDKNHQLAKRYALWQFEVGPNFTKL